MNLLLSFLIPAAIAGPLPGQAATQPTGAERLLEASARAYQAAAAFEDTIRYRVRAGGLDADVMHEGSFALAVGEGTDARIEIPAENMVLTASGGDLFIEDTLYNKRYVRTAMTGNLLMTLEGFDGIATEDLPLHQLALRYGKDSEQRVKWMGLGLARNVHASGASEVEFDGKTFDEVRLAGQGVSMRYRFDRESRFLRNAAIELESTAGTVYVTLTFDPKAYDQLPTPIVFEPGARREISSMDDLALKMAVGDALPAVSLRSLEGAPVDPREYKGSLLVLDFWATWCGICVYELSEDIDRLAAWVAEESLPVKVLAISVLEDVPEADRVGHVRSFWDENEFSFPTLIDPSDEMAEAFDMTAIPQTILVGPHSVILEINTGYAGFEKLKSQVLKALGRESARELHSQQAPPLPQPQITVRDGSTEFVLRQEPSSFFLIGTTRGPAGEERPAQVFFADIYVKRGFPEGKTVEELTPEDVQFLAKDRRKTSYLRLDANGEPIRPFEYVQRELTLEEKLKWSYHDVVLVPRWRLTKPNGDGYAFEEKLELIRNGWPATVFLSHKAYRDYVAHDPKATRVLSQYIGPNCDTRMMTPEQEAKSWSEESELYEVHRLQEPGPRPSFPHWVIGDHVFYRK